MKTVTNPSKYLTPLNIPAGVSGNVEIVREVAPPGTKFNLHSMRTAMFGQKGIGTVSWDHPTTWHQLLIDGGRMMSDWPIEQKQAKEALKGMKGRVLVGGLGLGYAATVLAKKAAVKHIIVVDISRDVVKLVGPHTTDRRYPIGHPTRGELKLEIVNTDLFEYLKCTGPDAFDYAFYDIWASDGEGTFFETVCPLYELSKGKIKHPPICWNEGVMRGQLYHSLQSRLMWASLSPEQLKHIGGDPTAHLPYRLWEQGPDIWHNWSVPWFKWWKERRPDDTLRDYMMQAYCSLYGRWNWEQTWASWCITT